MTTTQPILEYVTQILREITADWDVGEITADTRLGHLGLESINLVYFIAEMQQHYGLRDGLFHRLRADATRLTDRRVGDIVDMVQDISLSLRSLTEATSSSRSSTSTTGTPAGAG
ncbi:MAG: acyl carrier protein, partial [Chloroflexi bacterium]|nr:acyl carrier protein [Chloroflexota bacterium]